VIPLLASENRPVLAQLAWTHTLLAFDFDGTLAPIVEAHREAEMTPQTAALFQQVCLAYPTAVISGRSHADVSRRLEPAEVRYVIGNHGIEPDVDQARFERFSRDALEALARALGGTPGVEIEDKRFSLAIHFRRSRSRREARRLIHRAAAELCPEARAVDGKCVVNILPPNAPNKGDALLRLREREGAATALYLGDDITDEDVFVLDQPGRLLSVRVGEAHFSAAPYFLQNQAEVDALLALLVELRGGEPAHGGRLE
jgi:trehalose 6-phosphate phosphatase